MCEVLVFRISSHILYEYYVTIPLNRTHVLTVSTELDAEKGKDEGMRKKVQYEAKTESNGCFYSCRHLFFTLVDTCFYSSWDCDLSILLLLLFHLVLVLAYASPTLYAACSHMRLHVHNK